MQEKTYIDSLYALLSRVFPQCRNIEQLFNRAAPAEKLENNDGEVNLLIPLYFQFFSVNKLSFNLIHKKL